MSPDAFFVMSAVIGTRPRIYLACARSFCEAPNLGPTKGSRPAEWGRPTCRRPVCRCGVVAARCADGVRSGGVSGRAAALQALRCASYRPRGGCTRVYKKMLSCTVPCTRQVWTLCVILSDLNRPELCFIEWHWSLCALMTSKFTVRDPIEDGGALRGEGIRDMLPAGRRGVKDRESGAD